MGYATKGDLKELYVALSGDIGRLELAVAGLTKRIRSLTRREKMTMASIDELVSAVHNESTVVDSVLALVVSLKASLDEALANAGIPADVQAKIDGIFDEVTADSARIGAAVTANTPAAPV